MELSLYRKYRPQTFAEVVGQDHVSPHPAERRAQRRGRPRLCLRRPARHRQDRAWPRSSPRRSTAPAPTPSTRSPSRPSRPAACATSCRRHRRLDRARRDRDGRRLQPRHRRHPRAARQGRLRAGPGPLQGLHHRRGPHAHQGGLQRPPEDARGAAAARRLRAGHDRGAQDPGDHPLALPALRLPPAAACTTSPYVLAPASPPARTSRSTSPRCSRSPRHAEGGFRDAIGTLEKLVDLLRRGRPSARATCSTCSA